MTVTFQVLTKCKLRRGSYLSGKNRSDHVFSVKGKPVSVQIQHCASGEIGANPARTPKIEESDGTAKYCIYPTPKGSTSDNVMQITNIQDPGEYNRNLYLSWSLKREYNSKVLKTERRKVYVPDQSGLNLGSFVNFSYSDLGDYKVGDIYKVNLSEGQKICAGTTLTIANIDQEKIDNIANNYTWYLDGKSQAYSNSDAKSFNLPTPGKTYTIMRKSEEIKGGETCQSILDSISVMTYDNISGAELTANKETVCYNEGVSLSISGMKGAGERVQVYYLRRNKTSCKQYRGIRYGRRGIY